jgi:leucine dehydrogenase
VYCYDQSTGLKALIAIHNTTLGPALGGTRMWNYHNEQEALTDVLRLSRGMTFKASISGLNLGGGKAVLIGDARTMKTEAYLRRFGKFIQGLAGKYVTAEDVNMKTSDMEYIGMETKYVTGLPESMGGGGDPSPMTAYGTYLGIKATAKKVFGSEDLSGKKIGVQGIGQVGTYKIYDLDMDIFAPCALGATLNDDTIPRLKCAIVAGSANNQLKDEIKHGYMLIDRGITYAPDFLINAGGLINVGNEFYGNYNRDRVYQQTEKIFDTCLYILKLAEKEKITSQEAAIQAAEKRIAEVGQVRIPR